MGTPLSDIGHARIRHWARPHHTLNTPPSDIGHAPIRHWTRTHHTPITSTILRTHSHCSVGPPLNRNKPTKAKQHSKHTQSKEKPEKCHHHNRNKAKIRRQTRTATIWQRYTKRNNKCFSCSSPLDGGLLLLSSFAYYKFPLDTTRNEAKELEPEELIKIKSTKPALLTSHVQPGTQLQGPWLVCVLINHANLCEVTNDLSTGGICNTERPKQCGGTLHNVANGPMLVSSLFLSPSLSHKASFFVTDDFVFYSGKKKKL